MSYKVTVIMPAYNAEKYIEQAILSVLEQTEKCRLIIVNDASLDGTSVIASRYQELYPSEICFVNKKKNEGVCAARNLAMQMADTEYVAFLDADDWWSPEKIECQLRKINESGASACYSGRELMTEQGLSTEKIVEVPENITYEQLLNGNVIPCSSVLIKKDDVIKYPMVHDELHEDYILWLSMLKDGYKFIGINKPFLKSRLGEGGKSRNKWKSAFMTYKVYRYIGLSRWRAIKCFVAYAFHGVMKYRGCK